MKTIICIFSVAIFLSFLSCHKDDTEFPNRQDGKLKRKLSYRWIEDTIPYSISEYEYDSFGQIIKIQNQLNAELFKYNKNGQLISKYDYQIDNNGSTLKDTTTYSYENGLLVFEEIVFLPQWGSYTSQTKYEYENSKLIKKTKYRDQVFDSMTFYEYSEDLCMKELFYFDSTAVKLYSYRSNGYENGKLMMSTLVGFAAGNQKYVLQTVYYIYDDSERLVMEYATQNMEISAWISYCYRYEYD